MNNLKISEAQRISGWKTRETWKVEQIFDRKGEFRFKIKLNSAGDVYSYLYSEFPLLPFFWPHFSPSSRTKTLENDIENEVFDSDREYLEMRKERKLGTDDILQRHKLITIPLCMSAWSRFPQFIPKQTCIWTQCNLTR